MYHTRIFLREQSRVFNHIYIYIYDSSRIENSHDDDRGITGFFKDGNQYKELHEDIIRNDSIRHTSVQSKTNTKTDKRMANSHDVVLQLPHSIADIDDSDNSQLPSSPEMYSLSFNETQDVVSMLINGSKRILYNI